MSTPGLSGLNQITGLQGYISSDPEATPFEIQGGPVNPAHARPGEAAPPYSWDAYQGALGTGPHGPYGPENELLGDLPEGLTLVAGMPSQDPLHDSTPYRTHGGPWPRGMETSVHPDAVSRQLEQSRELHAVQTGASARLGHLRGVPAEDQWQDFYTVMPGESLQATDVPPQLKGATHGFGTRSREQSFAAQNEYGFDSSHRHRRYAAGSIPGNYLWMKPGGRPMVKSLPGPARPPVGSDSPFHGNNVGATFSYDTGAILQGPATEYVAPPSPYTQPAAQAADTAPDIPLW